MATVLEEPRAPGLAETDTIRADKATPRWSNGLDWPAVFWLGLVHVGALAASFTSLGRASWPSWCFLGHRRAGSLLGILSAAHARQLSNLSGRAAAAGAAGHLGGRRAADHLGRRASQASPVLGQAGRPALAAQRRLVESYPLALPAAARPRSTEMIGRYGKGLLKDRFMWLLDKTFLVWH